MSYLNLCSLANLLLKIIVINTITMIAKIFIPNRNAYREPSPEQACYKISNNEFTKKSVNFLHGNFNKYNVKKFYQNS